MREWHKYEKLLNSIIPMLWEGLGRKTKQGYKRVNGAVLIEANMDPADIRFDAANESKCIFLYTGSTPLQHKKLMKITKEIEDLGKYNS